MKKSWKALVTDAVFGSPKSENFNTFNLYDYNEDYYISFSKVPLSVKTFAELAEVEGSGVYIDGDKVNSFTGVDITNSDEEKLTPDTEILFENGVAKYILAL